MNRRTYETHCNCSSPSDGVSVFRVAFILQGRSFLSFLFFFFLLFFDHQELKQNF